MGKDLMAAAAALLLGIGSEAEARLVPATDNGSLEASIQAAGLAALKPGNDLDLISGDVKAKFDAANQTLVLNDHDRQTYISPRDITVFDTRPVTDGSVRRDQYTITDEDGLSSVVYNGQKIVVTRHLDPQAVRPEIRATLAAAQNLQVSLKETLSPHALRPTQTRVSFAKPTPTG